MYLINMKIVFLCCSFFCAPAASTIELTSSLPSSSELSFIYWNKKIKKLYNKQAFNTSTVNLAF